MSLKWTDSLEIALALDEVHSDVDPRYVRFTDLHKWVCALDEFARQAKPSSWVERPIQSAAQPIARASASRASSGRLFWCDRCAANTCFRRERSSAPSSFSACRFDKWPKGPVMRSFSHFG